jgi:hypothetical protein
MVSSKSYNAKGLLPNYSLEPARPARDLFQRDTSLGLAGHTQLEAVRRALAPLAPAEWDARYIGQFYGGRSRCSRRGTAR